MPLSDFAEGRRKPALTKHGFNITKPEFSRLPMHVINLVPRIEQKRTQQDLILALKLEHVICELKKVILQAFHFMLKSRWQSRERARRAVFYRRALRVLRSAEDMQQNNL